MKKKSFLIFINIVGFILFASTLSNSQSTSASYFSQNELIIKIDSVIDFGNTLLGKPYGYVLKNGKTMDCSGFVSYIYKNNGVNIPRSASSIGNRSKKIEVSEIKKGDLMFFKGRNISSQKIGHVSIVSSVNGDLIEMMHSCSRGIIKEIYNRNKYYKARLLFTGRLPQFSSVYSLADSTKNISITEEVIHKNSEQKDTQQINSKTIKIIGVGDIMLGTNFPSSSYLPPNDGKDILSSVNGIIKTGDISFGNLEGVILTGSGSVKKCSNPKFCYAFKMPDHYVNHLSTAGFNLLSIANNHVLDFGQVGKINTMKLLNDAGIPHAGLIECPYTTFEKKGIKYGFAAFSPNRGTLKINNYIEARKIISHLDTICDIVIVSFHGGAEGSKMTHITRKTEIYLGENRGNPYQFARIAIDAGADVIFGHGPHVTRAIDIYKDRFIAYSLGNFATYGRFNLSGPNGISPIIELEIDSKGKFINGKIHSTKQIGKGGPVLDENNKVLNEIIKLTKTDIPECDLLINSEGVITKRDK